jgi:hypothetical protein
MLNVVLAKFYFLLDFYKYQVFLSLYSLHNLRKLNRREKSLKLTHIINTVLENYELGLCKLLLIMVWMVYCTHIHLLKISQV